MTKPSYRSRHLVDPLLAPLLDLIPHIDLSAETLEAFRARELPQPEPSDAARRVVVTKHKAPGRGEAPDVPVALHRPAGANGLLPVILHIHGGGYVSGSVDANEVRQREMSASLGCAIVSVDYRLAPETPFPGSIEDCYATLAWVAGAAGELGIDAARIVVKGESAGGGLAAALALLARDRGEFALALQHLTYPMLDDRTATTRPSHPYAGEFLWTGADNLFGWTSLLGGAPGGEGVSPYAAPARAEDLADVAPAYIMTGALDLFAEECTDYVRRLIGAGVPAEFHLFPGGFHGFDLVPNSEVAGAARASGLAALHRALWPVGSPSSDS